MALSYTVYQADGNTTQFAIPFGYLRRTHVFVFVDGTMTGFKWISPTNIEIDPAPAVDAEVKVQRLTDKVNRITDFADGQTLLAGDLDAATLQNFYLVQEMIDGLTDGVINGDVVITNPPLPGNPITSQEIQDLLNEAARNSPVVDQLLNDTLVNSQAIVDETTARLAALAAEAQARVDGIAAEATARQAELAAEQAARIAAISGIQLQLDADVANLTALGLELNQEIADRVAAVQATNDALTQEVTDRQTAVQNTANNLAQEILDRQGADTVLQANVDAVVASANQNAALIATETQARIDGDAATATQLTIVSAAANRVRTYYQPLEPTTGMEEGDLWFDTDDGNKAYRYSGTLWQETDDTRIADALAQIVTETTARVDGDNALSSQITSLTAQVGTNSADIIAVNTAVTNESSARATAIAGLQTQVDGNAASIASNATAISTETSARVSAISALQTQVDGNAAAITTEQTARSDADSALSLSLSALTTRVGTAEADILTVNTAIATETSARATAISGLQTQVDGNAASIASNSTAISTETSARTSQFNALQTQVNGNAASILSEITARTNADSAIASDVSALTTRMGTAEAGIVSNQSAISTESSARATAISGLQTEVDSNEAAILAEQTARSTADSALASDISGLTTRMGTAEANIIGNATAISTADSANATQFNAVNARIDTAEQGSMRGDDFSITAERPTLWSDIVSGADMDAYNDPSASFGPYDALPAWQRSDKAYIGPRYGIPVAPGDRIKVRWRVETLGNGTQNGSTFQTDAYGYSDPTTFTSNIHFGSDKLTTADGVTFLEHEATIPAGTYFIRPYLYVNTVTGEDAPVAVSAFFIENASRDYSIEASVIAEQNARASADSAIASDVTGLQTRMGDAEADILTNATAISNETSARATETSALQTQINTNAAAVVTEANARSSQDSALASDISGLTTRMTSAEADVIANATAISTESSSRASALNVVTARYTTDAEALVASGDFSATFEKPEFFTGGVSTNPDYRAALPPATLVEAEGQTVWQSSSVAYPAPLCPFRVEPGDRVRIKWRGKVANDGSQAGSTVGSFAYTFGDDRVYITSIGFPNVTYLKKTAADGSFELDAFYDVPAGVYYIWPYAYINLGASEDATVRYYGVSVSNENAAAAVEADVEAQIVSEASTRASADTAIASDLSALTTRVGDAEAAVVTNATAIATETTARTTLVDQISARYRAGGSSGSDFRITAADTDAWSTSISGTSIDFWAFSFGTLTDTPYGPAFRASTNGYFCPPASRVTPGDKVRMKFLVYVSADGAGGDMVASTGVYGFGETGQTSAAPGIGGVFPTMNAASGLQEVVIEGTVGAGCYYVRPYCYLNGGAGQTSEGNMVAYEFENLTDIEEVSASLTEVRDVLVDGNGDVNAFYTLKTDVNGNVAGFGLSNSGTSSEFAILADQFLIVDPSNPGGTPTSPFSVIGGVTYIVNAKIGTAVIDDAAITNLKIGDLEIESEKFARKAVINADGDEGYLSHGTGLWNDYVTNDLTLVTVSSFTVKEDSKVIGRLTFTPKDLSTTLALKFRAFNTQSSYHLKLMLAIFRGTTKVYEEVLYDPVLTGNTSFTDLPNILSKKLRFEDNTHAAGTYDYRAAILGVQSATGIGDGTTALDVGWHIDDIGAQLELLEARDN